MLESKRKYLRSLSRAAKRLVRKVQSPNDRHRKLLAASGDRGAVVIANPFISRETLDQRKKAVGLSENAPLSLYVPKGHGTTNHDIESDALAFYTERANILSHELVKGIEQGWAETELNRREVCHNPECKKLFWKEHDSQEFCSKECREETNQRDATSRMQSLREEKERRNCLVKIIVEGPPGFPEFQAFMQLAGGNVGSQMKVGKIIKQIPDEWKTVKKWLLEPDLGKLWDSLSPKIWQIFDDRE